MFCFFFFFFLDITLFKNFIHLKYCQFSNSRTLSTPSEMQSLQYLTSLCCPMTLQKVPNIGNGTKYLYFRSLPLQTS
uniref:Putative secreted protein n=1 Tax=Rhipicephalus microplus TaxID=6941 RepID=A0A6M2DCK2_RHIMP